MNTANSSISSKDRREQSKKVKRKSEVILPVRKEIPYVLHDAYESKSNKHGEIARSKIHIEEDSEEFYESIDTFDKVSLKGTNFRSPAMRRKSLIQISSASTPMRSPTRSVGQPMITNGSASRRSKSQTSFRNNAQPKMEVSVASALKNVHNGIL